MPVSEAPLRVAIVGAGPSGLYCADHLLAQRDLNVEVDIFDRLPTPWGLIRNGVAPDHQEKKLITDRRFQSVMDHPAVRFFGNVEIGRDIPPDLLGQAYHAVTYAIGCDDDRRLNIPGEDKAGCWGAREFVAWYNGHPDFSDLEFDFSSERAVVIGNGNVAIDIARILLKSPEELLKSDISDRALQALRNSAISEVVILGRRGCVQASCHSQMLAELANLPDVCVRFEDDTDFVSPTNTAYQSLDWDSKQRLKVMNEIKARPSSDASRIAQFAFFGAPVEVIGDGKVEGIKAAKTRLEKRPDGSMSAAVTGETTDINAGLVIRSIGYRGKALAGVPFSEQEGVIPNRHGRVTDGSEPLDGIYVTGWIKRGPSGVIGSNRKCATETVECLVADYRDGKLHATREAQDKLSDKLVEHAESLVSRELWKKIDQQERLAGKVQKRPRVKIIDKEELMACAKGSKAKRLIRLG